VNGSVHACPPSPAQCRPPVFSAAQHLGETFDARLGQKFEDFELVGRALARMRSWGARGTRAWESVPSAAGRIDVHAVVADH
jgi:hypothetical protein